MKSWIESLCEIGGVGTDIILVHLNPHSFKAHLKGIGELGYVTFVNLERKCFQHLVKLPGKRVPSIVTLIRTLESFTKAKVLKEGTFALKEIVA